MKLARDVTGAIMAASGPSSARAVSAPKTHDSSINMVHRRAAPGRSIDRPPNARPEMIVDWRDFVLISIVITISPYFRIER
jgi:hypothetical protein